MLRALACALIAFAACAGDAAVDPSAVDPGAVDPGAVDPGVDAGDAAATEATTRATSRPPRRVADAAVAAAPVPHPPVAIDDVASVDEDGELVLAATAITGNDLDADGDGLALVGVGPSADAAAALIGVELHVWPAPGVSGLIRVPYRVSDGALTDDGELAIWVRRRNHPPIAVDDTAAAREDETVAIDAAALLANDADADGDPLAIVAVSDTGSGHLELIGDQLLYTPWADFAGWASIAYTVSDGSALAEAIVMIDVAPVPDPPVLVGHEVDLVEDEPLAVPTWRLLEGALDVDSPLEALRVVAVDRAVDCDAVLDGERVIVTAGEREAARFDYLVSDGEVTARATVTLTVGLRNDPPIAVTDALATDEDAALAVPASRLEANDRDVDSRVVGLAAVRGAEHGAVSLDPHTRVVTFTPARDFHGAARFEYLLTDGLAVSVGVVTVEVAPVDDPPEAGELALTLLQGQPVAFALPASDPDGDPLSFRIVSWPRRGLIEGEPPLLTYVPRADFAGDDALGFAVTDGRHPRFAEVHLRVVHVVACGDGVVEAGEACDDGNPIDGDGCDHDCSATACGNGVIGGYPAQSITFVWSGSSCGTFSAVMFDVTSQRFGRGGSVEASVAADCACGPGLGSVTVTDPEMLAALGGDPVFWLWTRADLAWAVAVIDRGDHSETIVLHDTDGGGDAEARNPDWCAAGTQRGVVTGVERQLVEACDDGNTVDGDGCSATCTVETSSRP